MVKQQTQTHHNRSSIKSEGGDASKLAIQEKSDLPITAKRVAGSGLYKLINKK
jgi:hypothetical protein